MPRSAIHAQWQILLRHRLPQPVWRLGGTKQVLQRLDCSERHLPYSEDEITQPRLLSIRGIYGLSVLSHFATTGAARLCKSGSPRLSDPQLCFPSTKALPLLASYADIRCYLDNDHAGTDALQQLKQTLGRRISDVSQIYSGCKDLNDYLINRNAEVAQKSRVQDRPIRPRRL